MHKQFISVTAAMVAIAAFGCGGSSSDGSFWSDSVSVIVTLPACVETL